VVEAVLLVDFAVLFACFFTPAFLLVLLVVEVVLAIFELEAAGAGAVCAKRDTPARASVIVIPIIAFFIVFFLWKLMFCSLLSL